jgi:hypothetical protein
VCVPELPAEERDAYVRRVSACEGLLNLGAQVVRTTAHMLAAVARPRTGAPRAERERGPFDQLCQLQRRVLWQLALAEEWRRAGGAGAGAARAGSDAEAAGGAGQAAEGPAAGAPLAPAGSGEAAGAADATMEAAPGGAGGAEGAPGEELAAAGAEDRWELARCGAPSGREGRDGGRLGPPDTGVVSCAVLLQERPGVLPQRPRLAPTSDLHSIGEHHRMCSHAAGASAAFSVKLARGCRQGTVLALVTAQRAITRGRRARPRAGQHARLDAEALRRAPARRDAADPAAAAANGRRGKKSGADLAHEVLQHFAVAARAFLTACAKVRARAAPPRRAAAAAGAPLAEPQSRRRKARPRWDGGTSCALAHFDTRLRACWTRQRARSRDSARSAHVHAPHGCGVPRPRRAGAPAFWFHPLGSALRHGLL